MPEDVKKKKNPYDEGTDGYYSWMKSNEPEKYKAVLESARKEMGITKKEQKSLPNYAVPEDSNYNPKSRIFKRAIKKIRERTGK